MKKIFKIFLVCMMILTVTACSGGSESSDTATKIKWNKENKFTGWTDVDLSENGIKEAKEAGKLLKENNITFDIAFTSVLKRAINTLNYVLEETNLNVPVKYSYKLNERH